MKLQIILVFLACVTLPLNAANAQLTNEQADVAKATADYISAKAEAAAKHNVYVHLRKGDRAHILYDAKTKNAIPITIFQNQALTEVKFCNRGDPDVVLVIGKLHLFQINEMDSYAICKNNKVFVINTVTNQLGTIMLKTSEKPIIPPDGKSKANSDGG